jgi:hypothetical protein
MYIQPKIQFHNVYSAKNTVPQCILSLKYSSTMYIQSSEFHDVYSALNILKLHALLIISTTSKTISKLPFPGNLPASRRMNPDWLIELLSNKCSSTARRRKGGAACSSNHFCSMLHAPVESSRSFWHACCRALDRFTAVLACLRHQSGHLKET